MTNIFPTDYTTKVTPDWTDVVWSSDAVTNFNLTIASIALYTLTNSTTDDLTEWSTNKYYSDSLVDSNATVIWKADKTNVLEKDNTTVYTPTLPYHPVTKDYADNISVPDASETVKWIVQRATDAEVTTATDITKYVTSNQLEKTSILQTTRWYNQASSIVVIPHLLPRTPKYIEIVWISQIVTSAWNIVSSHWFSNKLWCGCTWVKAIDGWSSIDYISFNDNVSCIVYWSGSSSWSAEQTATVTFDSTNINIDWTYNGASGTPSTMQITIIAHA